MMDLFENLLNMNENEDKYVKVTTVDDKDTEKEECVDTKEESAIIKDEKDIEQVVENVEVKTEDADTDLTTPLDRKELFAEKAKKFGEKVDMLATVLDAYDLNKWLSTLDADLQMDVYTEGEPYPSDADGYFSDFLDNLDLNDEADLEEFNWVDEAMDSFLVKIDEKIKDTIGYLKNQITDIETKIAKFEEAIQ